MRSGYFLLISGYTVRPLMVNLIKLSRTRIKLLQHECITPMESGITLPQILQIQNSKDLKNIKCQSHYFFDKRIKQSTINCCLRLTEMLQSAGSSQYCTMQIFSFVLTFSMLWFLLFNFSKFFFNLIDFEFTGFGTR